MQQNYKEQVQLLVEVLPYIAKEKCFALKGGTAINLLYNNLPRLSVDIDLTYVDFENREIACQNINNALAKIAKDLNTKGYIANIQGNNIEKKIICANKNAKIKIEPNYVIRGVIKTPEILNICEKVEDEYGYAEIQVVSKSELYGGKICAALDRQHPRDLFDINNLLESDKIDDEIIKGFITMLLSHDKPLHEALNPNIKNQTETYNKQFVGMTDRIFTYSQHIQTLNNLIKIIKQKIMPYRNLLLDFVQLEANLKDFSIENLDKLPAIKWKLKNLEKLQETNTTKFEEQYNKLAEYFNM